MDIPHRGCRRLHQVVSTSWSTARTTWWSRTRRTSRSRTRRRTRASARGTRAALASTRCRSRSLSESSGFAVLGSGYTGQITANSFMKREFGKKLIEDYFPRVDLTHVIDTSGAYHPWASGLQRSSLSDAVDFARSNSTIRAVLGHSWRTNSARRPGARRWSGRRSSQQVDKPGSESEWVSVADLARDRFAKHPWSLSGGGAADLRELIDSSAIIGTARSNHCNGIRRDSLVRTTLTS